MSAIKLSKIRKVLQIVLISMIGCVGVVFSELYIETFNLSYSNIISAVSIVLISILTILSIFFLNANKKFVYRLFYLTVSLLAVVLCLIYTLKSLGIMSKFDSIDKFRSYVLSFGDFAVVVFILIQFLQVVVLPVPAVITVGAGVIMFGAFWGAVYSCIGIIIGSIVAYYIGRAFGVKVVKWLIGEVNLNKGLKIIKGKDRVVLTFMFLFPFFPDDVLCFAAGVTTVKPLFFCIMIFFARIISVFASSFSLNNSIIPYDTWWGILLWLLFFILTVILTFLIYKNGEKLEKLLTKKGSE